MKLSRGLLLTNAAFLLSLPVQAQLAQTALQGTWYSEMQDQGETIKRLVKRESDNSYASLLLICEGKDFSWVQKERGSWEMKDGELYTTMSSLEDMNGVKQADPAAATAHYVNLKLADDKLSYDQKDKDNSFNFVRVDEGYQIRCE